MPDDENSMPGNVLRAAPGLGPGAARSYGACPYRPAVAASYISARSRFSAVRESPSR